jgi:hypothetical protein
MRLVASWLVVASRWRYLVYAIAIGVPLIVFGIGLVILRKGRRRDPPA